MTVGPPSDNKPVRTRILREVTDEVGSLLEGGPRRGRQTIGLLASDQGAGIKSTKITVNGVQAAGEDLDSSCHPLPGALTSSLSPCPKEIGKVYTLDTSAPPFRNGTNKVDVCVFDYAQTGMPNFDCEMARQQA